MYEEHMFYLTEGYLCEACHHDNKFLKVIYKDTGEVRELCTRCIDAEYKNKKNIITRRLDT